MREDDERIVRKKKEEEDAQKYEQNYRQLGNQQKRLLAYGTDRNTSTLSLIPQKL
ncbi:hypothetical protein LOAG_17684 [Loa loa]|uniref:Uncharacterized protein n=1 Tax=Loa loa TaxID=7209 RepID=A0A1I7W0H4_LOALO|nr:hypothetical protein LOAG_17684 [Loa loa]EJD75106.1 hypothetical protein LOAG_17684 [Loa loa]